MRHDLLYRVIHFETTAGFQEEKFKALNLYLTWAKPDLKKVVESRMNKLIKSRYTKCDVSFKDIFPDHVDGKDTFEYMLGRTFDRPRDIIIFINDCLELCSERPDISAHIIKEAENSYSQERLQSLSNEWSAVFPDLTYTSQLLYGQKSHFEVSQITEEIWAKAFENIAVNLDASSHDNITISLFSLYTSKNSNFDSIRNYILREFYAVGLVGIKTGPTDSVTWTRLGSLSRLTAGQVRAASVVHIHPMFYRALGIRY